MYREKIEPNHIFNIKEFYVVFFKYNGKLMVFIKRKNLQHIFNIQLYN